VRFAERVERANFQNITDALGEAATLKLLSGDLPPCCEDDISGTTLVKIELSQPFKITNNKLTLAEPLLGKGAPNCGRGKLVRSFRFYNQENECVLQGTVTPPDDFGDMTLDNPSITAGQNVFVGSFVLAMRR
jgi:hypothetical protein